MHVEAGEADFGISPSETVISCHTSDKMRPLGTRVIAVAAILQTQTSAIVTTKSSGIDTPRKLDGRKYASQEGRFEMPIIQQMIKNDGGMGTAVEVKPGEHGLGIFNTLLHHPDHQDATWVFMPWEGVIARQKGVELNVFSLDDIPQGQTPILIGREDKLAGMERVVKAFLEATARGYKQAAEKPEETAKIVIEVAKHKGIELSYEMVEESAKELSKAYLDKDGNWGTMENERWSLFTKWLADNQIVTDRSGNHVTVPDSKDLFTNKYL